ncbi:hypothetical protein MTO96_018759 [Rhipicephalus appendiculatus]
MPRLEVILTGGGNAFVRFLGGGPLFACGGTRCKLSHASEARLNDRPQEMNCVGVELGSQTGVLNGFATAVMVTPRAGPLGSGYCSFIGPSFPATHNL